MDYLSNINSSLYLVYGLVALLIVLLIIIIIVDKKENKKKTDNLFNTLNMKVIKDVDNFDTSEVEVLDSINSTDNNFNDIDFDNDNLSGRDKISETVKMMNLDEFQVYKDDDLDKTLAQIRVESITKALEEANIDEKIEEDKYDRFEQEQEENAIISYEELMKSYDKLYSENEKDQYVDDDTIPINIKELYELGKSEKETKNDVLNKVDDLVTKVNNFENYEYIPDNSSSSFKSSPYISPVYGIQRPPIRETIKKVDNEIEDTTIFLNNLKELQNNLD